MCPRVLAEDQAAARPSFDAESDPAVIPGALCNTLLHDGSRLASGRRPKRCGGASTSKGTVLLEHAAQEGGEADIAKMLAARGASSCRARPAP
jgi:hypothetical protein